MTVINTRKLKKLYTTTKLPGWYIAANTGVTRDLLLKWYKAPRVSIHPRKAYRLAQFFNSTDFIVPDKTPKHPTDKERR